MTHREKAFSFLLKIPLLLFSLTMLTGCLGSLVGDLSSGRTPSSPSPSSTSSQIVTTMPPAVVGNVLVASNDEAPIVKNESNQPIRLDKESEEASVRFEGQNEE